MSFPLNPSQHEAVHHRHGPVMVLAGAGTGKTRVIASRIAHLLSSQVPPRSIAAMTFTNKAAREMRERLSSMCGPKKSGQVSLSTFHSFCLNILRRFWKEAGLSRSFNLVGTSDQLSLVRKALTESGLAGSLRPESLLYEISLCKNALVGPDQMARRSALIGNTMNPEDAAECYRIYQRLLKLNRAIDFDDCIGLVVSLLDSQPAVCQQLRQELRYVLVDEFQDTNLAQFKVLELLVPTDGNICVVGDDDQSIYSWRGAMYEILHRFERHFENPKMIKLEQNYRCTNQILRSANLLIKNNSKRKDKSLWSNSKSSEPVHTKVHESSSREARWVSTKILSLLGAGRNLDDIAILYRTNAQARPIELALKEASIRSRTFGGQSFFEKKEVKDFFAFLRLATSLEDTLSFWQTVNTPPRGLGLKAQEAIERTALDSDCSPFKTLETQLETLGFTQPQVTAARTFTRQIRALNALPLRNPDQIRELASRIIKDFKLIDHLASSVKDPQSRINKMNSLKGLPDLLYELACNRQIGDQKGSKELIDSLTLDKPDADDRSSEAESAVSLMTIHAAKGLEFPVVFVVGLEEGALPHKNSLGDDAAIEEERRLMYVAMTRAKQVLILSHSKSYEKSITVATTPSRFLDELGDTISKHEKVTTPSQRKKSTLNTLSKLRQSLT